MQTLKVYQSLWAMQLRGPDGIEHGNEKAFEMIAEAGYHGICIDPTADEIAENRELKPLFEQHELEVMINGFPKSDDDLKALLEFSHEMNAKQFSIIGTVYPLSVDAAVPIVERWIELANTANVPMMFETHRDCITNDMFFTLELLERVPEMRLCADFSHYVVNRELALPLNDFWHGLFDRLLQRSDSFQGRIANREQVQVPLGFNQHQDWEALFKTWWARGFSDWRSRADENAELVFLCELGPPPYAITDANQKELSNRWDEALLIKSWVENIWSKNSAKPIQP